MKSDKKILLAAKIAACRELYLKYQGRSHKSIEAEMRELGWKDFSRRILYPRKSGRGKRAGWIVEYGFPNFGTPDAGVPDDLPDFQAWLNRVSPGMTWDWRHQIYLYERLKLVTAGICKRLMIFMPPRHGKSELVTVRYTAWRMRRQPRMKVILASYAQELANTFSRKVKGVICDDLAFEHVAELAEVKELQSSKKHSGSRPPNSGTHQNSATTQSAQSVFPFSRQRPVNTAAQWGTTVGGGLRAVGVGGGVTGFGADLIVIDDPVKNRAQAESETYRERVWDWYNNDLYTRLEPQGAIVLIQTRWHEDDLAGRLLKQMENGGEQWMIVDLPALAESEPPAPACGMDLASNVETSHHSTRLVDEGYDATPDPLPVAAVPPADGGGSDSDAAAGNAEAVAGEGASAPVAGGQHARAPLRVIGFPRLYSHVNAAAGKADALVGTAANSAIDVSEQRRSEVLKTYNRHAGGTTAAGEGGHDASAVPLEPAVVRYAGRADKGDPLNRRPGDALCPERYDKPELEQIRSQLGVYGFSSLYQQKPTPADGAIFRREWLRNIIDAPPPGLRWYRGYDLAISTKTTADYTASFRVAVDELGSLYIADGFRKRIEYPEQRRYILDRIRTERDTQHGLEDSVHAKAVIQELRRDVRLFQHSFKCVPVVGDKLTRALKWSPRAEEGKLKLVRGPWIDGFINELIRFPNGNHDDQIDAVSIAVQMMAEMPDKKLHRFR